MKYFTREEVEYHIRKNYRIKENDNFLPYVLDKADKEGIDEIFFEKNGPLYEKMAFIRILRSAFPPSYYTKDNDYYEQKATVIFLLAILFFFGAFIYALFFGEVKGSNTNCLLLSSFIYYAKSENSRMELSRLYWPSIKKRVDREITPILEAKAKAIFDREIAELNKFYL